MVILHFTQLNCTLLDFFFEHAFSIIQANVEAIIQSFCASSDRFNSNSLFGLVYQCCGGTYLLYHSGM